jgi:hypothetical protein
MNKTRGFLYLLAKLLGDFQAARKGRVAKRVVRRAAGRGDGQGLGKALQVVTGTRYACEPGNA